MTHRIEIGLTLHFSSKWHSGSGEGDLVTSRLVRRDSLNRPYVPASTLKGVIRENCEKLSRTIGIGPPPTDPHDTNIKQCGAFEPLHNESPLVETVFGTKYQEGGLFFRDARLGNGTSPYAFSQSRTRVHRMIRTTKEKHLFSSEYIESLKLQTKISGYHEELLAFPDHPPYAYCLLLAGILAVDRIGGDKSTGSGKLKIHVDSLQYNDQDIAMEDFITPLDIEYYELSREDL